MRDRTRRLRNTAPDLRLVGADKESPESRGGEHGQLLQLRRSAPDHGGRAAAARMASTAPRLGPPALEPLGLSADKSDFAHRSRQARRRDLSDDGSS